MKKKHIILKNITLLTFIFSGFIACDKDFASIESDVVNSDNTANFTTDKATYPVITYNKKITPFQSNRLPAYLLGYYNDPVFGTSTANFVAQMLPNTFDPTFGENIVLDSIILNIPYLSTSLGVDDEGNTTYKLDSVYGNTPIKLSVFQNNFFLRSFDPESEFNDSQKYFSNGATSQTNFINPTELEGQLLYINDTLVASDKQILLTEIDTVTNEPVISDRLAPAIRVHLENPNDIYWQGLFFDKEGDPELSNQNNFADYFRGLYFKVEAVEVNGSLMQLNFASSEANITLYYTSDIPDPESDTEITQKAGTFILNFSGNLVNIFDNNFIPIPIGDPIIGDEKLYLKGGEGSMAVIDLFNGEIENSNGVLSPALEVLKNTYRKVDENGSFIKESNGNFVQNRLINEAYLEFFVDQSIVQGQEPDRLYIYDIENKVPLIDYFLDQSVSNLTINAKIDHLEPLVRVEGDPNGEGIKYKIRITEHLNNLIIRDSTNVKLGLVVTSNVVSIDQLDLLTEQGKIIPSGTILSPRGTVLFGNNTTNDDKKVKLTIYYTEPDN
jgi:Domain of unknown function (DUF4270)